MQYEIPTNTADCHVGGFGPYMEIMQINLERAKADAPVQLSFFEPSRNDGEEGLTGYSCDIQLPPKAMDQLAAAWLLHRGYGIVAYTDKGKAVGHSIARYANMHAVAEAVANLLQLHHPPSA